MLCDKTAFVGVVKKKAGTAPNNEELIKINVRKIYEEDEFDAYYNRNNNGQECCMMMPASSSDEDDNDDEEELQCEGMMSESS